MMHTRADVEALGVNWIQIKDQNTGLYTKNANGSPNWSPWFWLRDAVQARMRWIYGRMRATGKPECRIPASSTICSRMIQNATPAKLRSSFGSWQ